VRNSGVPLDGCALLKVPVFVCNCALPIVWHIVRGVCGVCFVVRTQRSCGMAVQSPH